MKRYLESWIKEDLSEKMVFLGGPRQVGKTTLAFNILGVKGPDHEGYLNWDVVGHQRSLLMGELPAGQKLLVLDEIHKYRKWRNLIKGFFDMEKDRRQFLVTGSARLDYFRRGGDSLQGRYHYYRLHPFSLYELNTNPKKSDLENLLEFGGFPEPLLKASERHWKKWQNERVQRVIQEDLLSLEQVRVLSQLSLLANLLPSKVGSILSVNNLRQDLEVAFETVERWLVIFENIYYCFRIQAYGFSQLRAAKKEKKLFLWDWSPIENPAARFENLVASNLLKYCHFLQDSQGERMDLRFYRDSNRRELDFVVLKNGKPLFAVECKSGEANLATNISYFSSRLPIPKYYQVHLGKKHVEIPQFKAEIIPLTQFAKILAV